MEGSQRRPGKRQQFLRRLLNKNVQWPSKGGVVGGKGGKILTVQTSGGEVKKGLRVARGNKPVSGKKFWVLQWGELFGDKTGIILKRGGPAGKEMEAVQ